MYTNYLSSNIITTNPLPPRIHKYCGKENIPHASLPPAFPVLRLSSWPPKHNGKKKNIKGLLYIN